jgi:hypothetical protein
LSKTRTKLELDATGGVSLLGKPHLNLAAFSSSYFGYDHACQNVYNVQVYLCLAAVDFAVESVPTRAGAEQISALEDDDEVVMANESGGIQAYLREHKVGCLLIFPASMPKRG